MLHEHHPTQPRDLSGDSGLNLEIKKILRTSMRYRLFKSIQRFTVLQFSKLMVVMIIQLSILSDTVVVLPYLVSMIALIFMNDVFYDLKRAREQLLPLLERVLIPYAMLTVLTQLCFQTPSAKCEN
jgi:hypothetical protein